VKSYSIWANDDWYIFWEQRRCTDILKERISIFATMALLSNFAYPEVKEMLDKEDFVRIFGYHKKYKKFLNLKLSKWIKDIEDKYKPKKEHKVKKPLKKVRKITRKKSRR